MLTKISSTLPDPSGKKIGTDITLYSVWFELRYGITACLFLTVLLLTVILDSYSSTSNVVSFYRSVPILPEGSGRVEEIFVSISDKVKAGEAIFRLIRFRAEGRPGDCTAQTCGGLISDRAGEDLAGRLGRADQRGRERLPPSYGRACDEDRTPGAQLSLGRPARNRTGRKTLSTDDRPPLRQQSPRKKNDLHPDRLGVACATIKCQGSGR